MKCGALYLTSVLSITLLIIIGLSPVADAHSYYPWDYYQPPPTGVLKNYADNETVPPGIVEGYVGDSWGYPIPNATVTLRMYGELWTQPSARWNNSTNPQYTPVYQYGSSREAGWYSFGFVEPGIYEVVVEKDGHRQSGSLFLGNRSIHRYVNGVLVPFARVDFTFRDYAVPGYANVDTSNAGAITGLVNDSPGPVPGVNVSLWQGEKLADTVNNPQLTSDILIPETGGNYLFEHLPQGQYRVIIGTCSGATNASPVYRSVFVTNDLAHANFSLPSGVRLNQTNGMKGDLPEQPAVDVTTPTMPSIQPTVQPTAPVPTPAPSPGPGLPVVVLVLLAVASISLSRGNDAGSGSLSAFERSVGADGTQCRRTFALISKVILLISFSLVLCVFYTACAQAQSATGSSAVYAAPSIIFGVVVDPWGHPVSNATVTLWQHGQLWKPSDLRWGSGMNPQASGYYQYGNDMPEGSFAFGVVPPGSYLLTAEKDGYTNMVIININGSMPEETFKGALMPVERVDIRLGNYPASFYPKKDPLNMGAITGLINDSEGLAPGVKVSLLQNGNIVSMVRNPQLSSDRAIPEAGGSYLFEHLSPGQYRVVIETADESGDAYKAYKAVYVDNNTQSASFNIPFNITPLRSTPAPASLAAPIVTPLTPTDTILIPTAIPSASPAAIPAPFPGFTAILTALGAAFFLHMRKHL